MLVLTSFARYTCNGTQKVLQWYTIINIHSAGMTIDILVFIPVFRESVHSCLYAVSEIVKTGSGQSEKRAKVGERAGREGGKEGGEGGRQTDRQTDTERDRDRQGQTADRDRLSDRQPETEIKREVGRERQRQRERQRLINYKCLSMKQFCGSLYLLSYLHTTLSHMHQV